MIKKYKTETSEKDICDFESEFKIKLPSLYRKFLVQYNGGYPEKEIYENGQLSLYIQVLFPLLTSDEKGLRYHLTFFPFKLPENVIPIGLEGTGHYICVDLRNDWILLFDNAVDYPSGKIHFNQLFKLEEDIDKFIGSLKRA